MFLSHYYEAQKFPLMQAKHLGSDSPTKNFQTYVMDVVSLAMQRRNASHNNTLKVMSFLTVHG